MKITENTTYIIWIYASGELLNNKVEEKENVYYING